MNENYLVVIGNSEYKINCAAPITNGADIQTDWLEDDFAEEINDLDITNKTFWIDGSLYILNIIMFSNTIELICVYGKITASAIVRVKEWFEKRDKDFAETNDSCLFSQVSFDDATIYVRFFYVDKV